MYTIFKQKMYGLDGFQCSDLAEILSECMKFDFAKILFQPRGCTTSLKRRGRSRPFRPLYMVLKWLPMASGCQKWPRPRAASSDLGFSKRSYSLEAGIKFLRNQILCIHTKYGPNRTARTLPNHTFLFKTCTIGGGQNGGQIERSSKFLNWFWKFKC